ncbi:MAG: C10 family peptidase [Candidatus Marinimicrobia bacterium]|jgi:hypothetical protein|nr:C10 family peptidase [Candidatus Neomarinimicrobiota bacterium]
MCIHRIYIILVIYGVLLPSSVSISDAEIVARNLYNMRRNFNLFNELKVESIEVLNKDINKLIYLFHLDPHGFIMVSADDRCTPVLAYSFNNSFELESIPPNVSWVVEKYKKNILDTINSNREASELVKSEWNTFLSGEILDRQQYDFVEPLISAEFDQGSGWNDFCPEGCGGGEEALVGCVAVSMGQIMHYWSFPIQGEGQNTYTDLVGDDPSFGTLSVNFSNSIYDYNAMGDGISSTDAAALLLYDAGVSVNMDYGCDESGAHVTGFSHPTAQYAFSHYFMFDDDIASINRNSLMDDEFIFLLKNEFNNNRPVIYVGYDEGPGDEVSGHAWNCDGYDEYNLFHMNWGWGGSTNGYYDINALTTSGNTFSEGQSILYNIQPEALNAPNLVLDSHLSYDLNGDGDNVINPGETCSLIVSIYNKPPWSSANSIELIISTQDDGIDIDENYSVALSSSTLAPGSIYANTDFPFIINVNPDSELGPKEFTLMVMGYGLEGADNNFFFEEYEIVIEISLNQYGFPIYKASQKTSPLVLDFDNDGNNEIIYGDYNGFVHIYNADGSEVENNTFPYDTGDKIWGSTAAADVDNDGLIDLIIASQSKRLYIFDRDTLKTDYDANVYLLGTPAIGNLDDDAELEIVFSGYDSNNKVFVINPDGSDVAGFPLPFGEKVKVGVALADFNGNGKDDIVVGTDSNYIHLFYDNGSEAPGFPYQVGDKIQSAPSILDVDGEKVIFVGSNDNNLYAINSDGSLRFSVAATNEIDSSPSFLAFNDTLYVFFSDGSGVLYAVDTDGNTLDGWPVDVGQVISKSLVFSDLDCDGESEVVAATESTDVLAYNLDGSPYAGFPMNNEFAFTAAPLVMDMDGDGDLEILAGSVNSLVALDIKSSGSSNGFWNMYRGNARRTGYANILSIGGDISECSELSTNHSQYLPGEYTLNPLFPNPFNPTTTISYSNPRSGSIMIGAYDIRGRLVENIVSTFQSQGNHSIVWDASRHPSGIYIIIMESGTFRETQKVLLIK